MQKRNIREIVSLTPEQKKTLMSEIESFYQDTCDEKIGIIKQQQILDLFLENLAPMIYNKALDDTKQWYKRQMENVEADFYELYKEER